MQRGGFPYQRDKHHLSTDRDTGCHKTGEISIIREQRLEVTMQRSFYLGLTYESQPGETFGSFCDQGESVTTVSQAENPVETVLSAEMHLKEFSVYRSDLLGAVMEHPETVPPE